MCLNTKLLICKFIYYAYRAINASINNNQWEFNISFTEMCKIQPKINDKYDKLFDDIKYLCYNINR